LKTSRDKIIEKLENFDLNNAHCFDPNEEFKLRSILEEIGSQHLLDIMKEIAITVKTSPDKFMSTTITNQL